MFWRFGRLINSTRSLQWTSHCSFKVPSAAAKKRDTETSQLVLPRRPSAELRTNEGSGWLELTRVLFPTRPFQSAIQPNRHAIITKQICRLTKTLPCYLGFVFVASFVAAGRPPAPFRLGYCSCPVDRQLTAGSETSCFHILSGVEPFPLVIPWYPSKIT